MKRSRAYLMFVFAALFGVVHEVLARVMIAGDVATSLFGKPNAGDLALAIVFEVSRVLAVALAPALACAGVALLLATHFSRSGAGISVADGAGTSIGTVLRSK